MVEYKKYESGVAYSVTFDIDYTRKHIMYCLQYVMI